MIFTMGYLIDKLFRSDMINLRSTVKCNKLMIVIDTNTTQYFKNSFSFGSLMTFFKR